MFYFLVFTLIATNQLWSDSVSTTEKSLLYYFFLKSNYKPCKEQTILRLASPSNETHIHLQKELKNCEFEVCACVIFGAVNIIRGWYSAGIKMIMISRVRLLLPVFSPIFRSWLCNRSTPALWRLTALDVRLRMYISFIKPRSAASSRGQSPPPKWGWPVASIRNISEDAGVWGFLHHAMSRSYTPTLGIRVGVSAWDIGEKWSGCCSGYWVKATSSGTQREREDEEQICLA